MANELSAAGQITFRKGSTEAELDHSFRLTIAGTRYHQGKQSISTTEKAIDMGSVGTTGYTLIKNCDTTNFVEIRPGTGVQDMIKIQPGGFALFQFADGVSTPYAIADTSAVEIEILAIEV
jgi:hypothetical protein